MVGLNMTDEIIIPASDSPVKHKIVLTEDMLTRSANELLKGNKSSKIFTYFVNFIIGRIISIETNDFNTIDENLIELTIDQNFVEQQTPSYKFSTIKYKRYLQHFVDEIKNSVLISNKQFALILSKDKKNTINSGNGEKITFKKSVTLGRLFDKTINEIINTNVASYPILPPVFGPKDISRDGWLISQFDRDGPIYDRKKVLNLFKDDNDNITTIKREGNNIILTMDTYTYFDVLLKDAGYKGLIQPKRGEKDVLLVPDDFEERFARPPDGKEDGKEFWYKEQNNPKSKKTNTIQYDKEKTDKQREGNFYITYSDKDTTEKVLTGEGLVLKNKIKGDGTGVAYAFGTFIDEYENPHTDADIEKLRKHIVNMTGEGFDFEKVAKLNFLKNAKHVTAPNIDTLSRTESVNGIIDLLFTPKDRKLKVGVLTVTYKITDKIDKQTLENKDNFKRFILTNSQSKKTKVEEGALALTEKLKEKVIKEKKELLEDVKNNTLRNYINNNSQFPIIFFERLLEEIKPSWNTAKYTIYENNKKLINENIDVDDTIETIQDKLSSEDTENNSIIEEDSIEEENEDEDEIKIVEAETGEEEVEEVEVDKSYFDILQKIINSFIKITEEQLSGLNVDNDKSPKIEIIKHVSSEFTELAILDGTGGARGGISEDSSQSRIYPHISGGKNIVQRKNQEARRLATKNAIVRQVKTLENAVKSIK